MDKETQAQGGQDTYSQSHSKLSLLALSTGHFVSLVTSHPLAEDKGGQGITGCTLCLESKDLRTPALML